MQSSKDNDGAPRGRNNFDLQSILQSLSQLPNETVQQLIPSLIEFGKADIEMRKVEADVEMRKVDADVEVRKVEAKENADAEVRKVEAKVNADAEVRKVEAKENAEMRKVEADAEVRKVEAKENAAMRKAEAEAELRKADAEIIKAGAKVPAKCTERTVMKYDAVGLKTKLAEEMQRLGLKGTIARVLRADSSGEYDTDFTFEGLRGNVEEMKKYVEQFGVEGVSSVFVPLVGYSNVKVEKTPDLFRRSRSSGSKELIYEVNSSQVSSVESGASSRTKDFRAAIQMRDGVLCVFCSETKHLEAAHIYPLSGRKNKPPIKIAHLRDANELRNGILLCYQCHQHFDRGLWWIELNSDTYVGKVSDALQGSDEKYQSLHNSSLNLDSKDQDAPLAATLKVQENFCKLKREQRHTKITKKPYRCSICCSETAMFSSKKNLQAHILKGTCQVSQTIAMFTPAKSEEPKSEKLSQERKPRGQRKNGKGKKK